MAPNPSFAPDLDAWDPWLPDQVAEALDSMPVPWAVAGGWAVDLHLGETTRPHADIEIAVARSDMEVVATWLTDLDWFAVGDGRAWPIAEAPEGLHQAWGRDESGRWRLDVFREAWEAGTWIFRRDSRIRRPLADAVELSRDGIPYLAPELVLLFKAKAGRAKDEADFALVLPTLAPDRIRWLQQALRIVHPGHDWIRRLTIES